MINLLIWILIHFRRSGEDTTSYIFKTVEVHEQDSSENSGIPRIPCAG